MVAGISIGMGLVLIVSTLAAEYVDSTLGMGYGTILTPLLLFLGFQPLQVVPAVLLTEAVTGIAAAVMHHAVGITSLAEGLTCLVGVLAYLVAGRQVHWELGPYLVIGALCSVPLSALTVRRIRPEKLRLLVGVATVLLGGPTVLKVLL